MAWLRIQYTTIWKRPRNKRRNAFWHMAHTIFWSHKHSFRYMTQIYKKVQWVGKNGYQELQVVIMGNGIASDIRQGQQSTRLSYLPSGWGQVTGNLGTGFIKLDMIDLSLNNKIKVTRENLKFAKNKKFSRPWDY